MKILFFGDVCGKTGRRAIAKHLPKLRAEFRPDLVLANAENLAHGKGVTIATLEEISRAGVDFFTSGNHIFDKEKEAREVFEKYGEKIIRPANLPENLPGKGFYSVSVKNQQVLILNLNGQVFMEQQFDFGKINSPFKKLDDVLAREGANTRIRILDFHAEATSEKRGMGFYADGKLSAVFGTHTHVPTADAQILPGGTGYQTDLGMVGAAHSVIGVSREKAIQRLISESQNGERVSLEVAESNDYEIGFAVLEIDEASGKCQNIISKVIYDIAPSNSSISQS